MSTTIQNQTAAVSAASAGRLPDAVAATFGQHLSELAEGGVPAGAVRTGDTLAPFTLPDATGKDTSLDELVASGPAVIVFYRGGWCPYCNVALRAYQADLLPQLERFGARLVAISPQRPDESLSTTEKAELTFTVLSDAGAALAEQLGIAFAESDAVVAAQGELGLDIRMGNADGTARIPMPTVLVVDAERVVRFVDIHPVFTERTEVAAIVAALQAL